MTGEPSEATSGETRRVFPKYVGLSDISSPNCLSPERATRLGGLPARFLVIYDRPRLRSPLSAVVSQEERRAGRRAAAA